MTKLERDNLFRMSIRQFLQKDRHLKKAEITRKRLNEEYAVLLKKAGYCSCFLYGPPGSGKTTAAKIVIEALLNSKFSPSSIVYIPQGASLKEIHDFLMKYPLKNHSAKNKSSRIFFFDEFSNSSNIKKNLKYLNFCSKDTFFFINSSKAAIRKDIKINATEYPENKYIETEFSPMSFKSFCKNIFPEKKSYEEILRCLRKYLDCGGFPVSAADLKKNGRISKEVKEAFIRKMLWAYKAGTSVTDLKDVSEVLSAISRKYGNPVTYSSLSDSVSPQKTGRILQRLYDLSVCWEQPRINTETLKPLTARPRKFHFRDPFISACIQKYLRSPPLPKSLKAESALASHINTYYTTCYISRGKEIDIAYTKNGKIFPIEIKWSPVIRSSYFNLISHFDNSVLGSLSQTGRRIGKVKVIPLTDLFRKFS
ncbi:MAG: AAA family ATPase [Fibrobacterota bacterium]